MRILAYTYSDPLLETAADPQTWGWDIDRVYQDLGQRTELQQLLIDCQNDPPDYVLVRRLDELGDNVEEVSDRLSQIEAIGITLVAVEQGYNSAEKSPNFHANLLRLLHQIQRQQHSRRIRQGHARNRLDAAPPPGKAPYGYRRGKDKYILDRSTSPVVKDFFEQFLLYGSLRGAVRYLAKKYGKKISVTTGRRWLTNPVYRGNTAYQNGEILANTHPPILSQEEAAQVDRLLRRNSRLPSRTASAPRSLAGLVVCGECQSPMGVACVTIRNQDKEYLYLRPISCIKQPKCRAIPYQEVLDHTIQVVCRDLPTAVDNMNSPQLDAVKDSLGDAIARQQEILTQLPALVETGLLDAETAKFRAYKLRTEISTLQAKLATLPPVNLRSVAVAVSIPQFWLDLSEAERRFYFREFIRQVKIIRQPQKWDLQVIFIF
ncbi:recombinase family protein [Fischerella thermalis]|uniref:recombinase family protein n=1 Tax=Fischerella thermalis TaxID=372787 RepID=UPI001A08B2D7|nr:recombinase family protein [Fischerella thermalis]MBF1988902.1 recombinase family protein [Fischerella thermalis M58_A2018_009]MBF2061556.1 recombinase family protein [Fischerella thermalis M66_A2018_004]